MPQKTHHQTQGNSTQKDHGHSSPNRDLVSGQEFPLSLTIYNLERRHHREEQGVPRSDGLSGISRVQWQLEPLEKGVLVRHSSSSNKALVNGIEVLNKGESSLLTRGEYLELPDMIGLKCATIDSLPEELPEGWRAAHGILCNAGALADADRAHWDVPGAYRIDRMHSLTGERIGDYENLLAAEHYLLMRGWCTIGSSSDAGIVVPDSGVASTHAFLLHVAGYFFLCPANDTTDVFCHEEKITGVAPLMFDTEFRVGGTTLCFNQFEQLFV